GARELPERAPRAHDLVAGGDTDAAVAPRHAQRPFAPVQEELLDGRLPPGDALGLGHRCGRREGLVERVHATQEAPELEPAEDLLEGGTVWRRRDQLRGVD